jgi:hypothetical protein
MRILFLALLAVASLLAQQPAAPRKPKLVVAIVIDQFRYDFLTRYRSQYTAGLNRLLTRGAVFTNANYEYSVTKTAPGHSTMLTGAMPSVSGIIGNEWWDRASKKEVTSVSDEKVKILGGSSEMGASPHRLLVDTVSDQLKIASDGKSRVISVSLKDRSAILPVGRMADAAYWVESRTGNIVSSAYYFAELPGWVKELNASRPADKFAGLEWLGHKMLQAGQPGYYTNLPYTPFSNEMIELMAEQAIAAEKLGQRGATDLLAVSFSGNDYVGHRYGPDSAESRDTAIRTDKVLDKLFRFIDARVGMQNVLVTVTADHGVTAVAELTTQRKLPGGRFPKTILGDTAQAALAARFGKEKWISWAAAESIYFDREMMRQRKVDPAEAQRVAADALRAVPNVARVYTRSQLLAGFTMNDQIGQRVQNSFNAERSGEILVVLDPFWVDSADGTNHGTPYNYDSHVPIIFMGPGIKPGRYHRAAKPNDIATTLATLLDVEIPSGSSGRVLDEMIAPGF